MNPRKRWLAMATGCAVSAAGAGSWPERMADIRGRAARLEGSDPAAALKTAHAGLMRDFPVETDWFSAARSDYELDGEGVPLNLVEFARTDRDASLEAGIVTATIESAGTADGSFRAALEALRIAGAPAGDRRWLDLFLEACRVRRERRLAALLQDTPRIVFIKRHSEHPSFYAYTEGQSDAQHERHFRPPSSLCLLEFEGTKAVARTLLDDPDGVMRDAEVSYDGARVLFAWKKSDRGDDYHLHELEIATGAVRQLTSGEGVADYEGRYLPDGGIVFASTRCVQTVDCWWTEVSNLYACDADGGSMRRMGYDQVHTTSPSVLDDGTVVYTRWDYNDRGQIFPQALFRMNPDGTGQTEYYGNSSWFPTVIGHARSLPGGAGLVAVLHGHHTWQAGELAILDRRRGTQEAAGVRLIAPEREAKPVRVDRYGQDGALFRHPYPLNAREFLVTMTPDKDARKRGTPFGLYHIDVDGNRELLAFDPGISCDHPFPLRPRVRPPARPPVAADGQAEGVFFVQDVYAGQGLRGVPRGTVKSLRVVALEFRAAGVGDNRNRGEAGGALVSTPISIGPGAWDVKRILGEAEVREDGSAMFAAPARTPVYFQAVDADGQVVQTMRSWSTLMPGETRGCVGCHEDKHEAPPVALDMLAVRAGAAPLAPFHGPPRGFSFPREIQPILDRHCVRCHDGTAREGRDAPLFSLTGAPVPDAPAKRIWSEAYVNLVGAAPRKGNPPCYEADPDRPLVNWISAQSPPTPLPPYHRGSTKSELVQRFRSGRGAARLDRAEMDLLCAWIDLGVPFCGDYREANAWTEQETEKYERFLRKREQYALDP